MCVPSNDCAIVLPNPPPLSSSPVDTPSASIDGATATPLERAMKDHSLGNGEMLGLLNQTSIVVAGVFEAALRYESKLNQN